MSEHDRSPKSRDLLTLHRYVQDQRFKGIVDLIASPMRARFDEYVAHAHDGVISPALQREWDQTLLYYADLVLSIESEERARCVEEIVTAYPEGSSREYVVANDIANLLMMKIRGELEMHRRDRQRRAHDA